MRNIVALVVIVAQGYAVAQEANGNPLAGIEQLRKEQSRRVSSSDDNWQNGNADARGIQPGDTLTVAELEGPGRITHIWFTIAAADPYYGRSVTVRMYWDGEETPSVESPLGDFFAAGHGIRVPVNSLPVQVSSEGRAYNCYWPMPFRKSAKITVTNDSPTQTVHALFWYVDWRKVSELPESAAYFHAQYRQEFPCTAGKNYLIFDGEGEGHYVGTVLSVHMNSGSWFGEGDDFFFIDGEAEPSLRGTGTEDYFCDAWGFRQFNNLYYGVSIWEGYDTDDHGTAYRWHLVDPVAFTKSLRVEIEHKGVTFEPETIASETPLNVEVLLKPEQELKVVAGEKYVYEFPGARVKSGFEERPDYLSSVAFWYQKGAAKRFAQLPPALERLVLATRIEGEALIDKAKAVPADGLEVQKGDGHSGKAQLFYHPVKSDAPPVLDVSFDVEEKCRYVLKVELTRSWDYGIYAIAIDDKTVVEEVDLYAPALGVKTQKLGEHTLEKGTHKLTFTYVRSNVESKVRGTAETGRYMALDAIDLRKVPAVSVRIAEGAKAAKETKK
jgi:hypothetical protein